MDVLLTKSVPWYYTSRPSVIPGIDDKTLSLLAPVLSYWILSLFFHLLDSCSTSPPFSWMDIEKHRIHDSDDEKAKNKATPQQVLRAVIFQQIIQTALGWWWVGEEPLTAQQRFEEQARAMHHMAGWIHLGARILLGDHTGRLVMSSFGTQLVYWSYWWIVPSFQFLIAFFVLDTWQYFFHRLFHLNKFLYKHVHSVHHRLYVPYAYGALYNHPLEGFLFDSLGAVLAEAVGCLSVRQASLLFGFSSAKTVDDHCGFSLPWDPLQFMYRNNARYHDVHHSHYGLKYNFSQPFWIHWDVVMGTRWDKPMRPLAAEKRELEDKDHQDEDSDVSSDSGIVMGDGGHAKRE